MTRLDLVVGPNGAGRSTFVELVLVPQLPRSSFVDADLIAAERWPDDPVGAAYEAAAVAAETRERLIALRRPLIAETVFSHRSKLDLISTATDAGYEVALHVVMVPEELSVARVRFRVASGGHDVPEHKIRERHQRLWALVAEAVGRVDTAHFWDSSGHDGPTLVARMVGGHPVGSPQWPSWASPELGRRWPSR